ncbi:MAG: PAS domain S-box protein [Candidatus Bathyarchaeota archaeon]|nr:PAS domain S-box protein [Candidatus Bathyarchaeota archaeon]
MLDATVDSKSELYADVGGEKKIHVLHVDDDAKFLTVAKQCLEEQGLIQVDTALSAENAMEKLSNARYDVVVADYQMTGKNGLELLKGMRQRGIDVPFILFTCKGKGEIAIEALNAGVERFIDKQGEAEATYEELRHSIINAVKRQRTEKLLREAENRLRQITENIQDILLLTDTSFIVTYASTSCKSILGYDPNDIVGKSLEHLIHPDDLPNVIKTVEKAMENRSGARMEARVKQADGRFLLLEGIGKILTDDKGQFAGAVLTCRDITERRRMEQAIEESEEKYRKLFEEAMDAIFVADAETGILVDCNRAATVLVGRPKSELIGMHQRLLHPEENAGKFSKSFEQHLREKEGDVIEGRIVTKNGEIRDVAIKGNLIEIRGKKMLQGIFRDITENKKSLERVNFQARMLNAVGQAIIATDMNGTITYWNLAAERLYGWSEAEVLGRNIIDITPAETSREQAKNILNRLTAGESWSGEILAKRRDGTVFQVIVTDAPIANDKGELIGIVGISTDITEQKWMQEVLEQAIAKVAELNEKLRVVGGLTRHDVRNKLSALNGRLYLLKKRCGDNVEAQQQITEMESISKQILRILEFEKVYVQVGAEELGYVDVESQLYEAASLFSDLQGIRLVNDCRGLVVLADSLLRQLFYNLIDNTLKYGEKTSVIRVYYEVDKDQLRLVYEDDGVGIPDDVRVNLFREGYGKGTGYGLYLIQRICEAYGWSIQETGSQGQGARFTMTVPKKSKDGKGCYKIS